ncbi:hypothetical protein FO440_23705 [Mucilaginibacter corticis]|uniref:Uncharacterized protein n=2 Tax=Mucilaginibacter corticis TaxID=2597670 RepID=A0A556M7X4_9SPHI|nr:hypothetical protein FO440_23705 [Mucilaginibacter corticis]
MEWSHYLAAFFSGAFLSNAVPHFVNGVSGTRFPTPFAKPPGRGLSSPVTNVLWAAFNLLIGGILWQVSRLSLGNTTALITFLAGFLAMGILSALNFQKKERLS